MVGEDPRVTRAGESLVAVDRLGRLVCTVGAVLGLEEVGPARGVAAFVIAVDRQIGHQMGNLPFAPAADGVWIVTIPSAAPPPIRG